MNKLEYPGLCKDAGLEAVSEAVEICFLYIDNVRLRVFQITEMGRKNEFFDEEGFCDMIDMMDVFVGLISDIYRTLKKRCFSGNFCAKTVQALEVHLLFVLKALFAAKHKRDVVILMDLLEHELMENIIQWKIKVVPELKRIKNMINEGMV